MTNQLQWSPAPRYPNDPIEDTCEYRASLNGIDLFLTHSKDGIWLLSCKELHISLFPMKSHALTESEEEAEQHILDTLCDKLMVYQELKKQLLAKKKND